jgi:hypothetical protein
LVEHFKKIPLVAVIALTPVSTVLWHWSLGNFDPREIDAFTFTPDAAEDEVPAGPPGSDFAFRRSVAVR